MAAADDGRQGIWSVLLSLPAPVSPGEALCFEEAAFDQAFYVRPAVAVL